MSAADEIDQGRVEVSLEGHVGTITLNRPRKLNALNATMRDGIFAAFTQLEAESICRCIVLTAAGRAFCVGGDLTEMAAQETGTMPRDFTPHLGRNIHVSKPVIAAVRGYAVAGGFLMAQMCDLCIASDSAMFGISEVKHGRGAPWAVPLIGMVPKRVMAELLMVGWPVDARRAYEVGLVNAVVSDDLLEEETMKYASAIAANAPLSVGAAKRAIQAAREMGESAALETADAIYESVYRSDDALEGPRAFAEGRDPVWTGR